MFKKSVKSSYNPFYLLSYLVLFHFLLFFSFISFKPLLSENLLQTFISAKAFAGQVSSLPKWPHEGSDLLPDPAVVFGKLPNGFRYALMENKTPKNRVSMHLNVQVGSMNEDNDEQGIAHFLEHLLFCGSTHFKPGELIKYFQSIGMEFGADANAHTGFFETVYDIFLPRGSSESIDDAFVVIKDYADGALLLQSEIERERGVILAEKRTRDSSTYRTFVETIKFEFPDVKISARLPIGKEKIIKNADKKLLKNFYDLYYRPENMVLVIIGDFDVQNTVSKINKIFSGLSARSPRPPPVIWGKSKHKGVKVFYHEEKETGGADSTIEVVRIIDEIPDSLAFQKQMLVKDIADRIVQNRIDAMRGKPDTPFISASTSSGIYLHRIEYAEISARSTPENWEKTLSLIEQILRKAIKYGFVPSELERVKKDYLAALDTAERKSSTRYSIALTRELIRAVNCNKVFMSPEQKKIILTPFLESITLKQVYEAFKETWSPEHRLILLTGNANFSNKSSEPEKSILDIYNQSKKASVNRPEQGKTAVFPYLIEPSGIGEIDKSSVFSDIGITQIDYKNGIRLNLKQTDFKADEISVKLIFGKGRSAEPVNLPGLSVLCENVINESGLGGLDKDELEQAFAGKNTYAFFGISDNFFYFTGETVKAETDLLFKLLYAHIVDPGFRKDAYSLSMEKIKQNHISLSHSIDGAISLSGARFLAGGDARFGFPSFNEISELTLENVKSWIKPSLKHDTLEISVVGDFDAEKIKKIVSKYFGTLEKRVSTDINKLADPLKFPAGKSKKIFVDTKIEKGLVITAYPTEDIWDISRTRRLSIMSKIFSNRVRDVIREKLGIAYSPFAFNQPSRAYKNYGVFQVFVHVKPDKTQIVKKEVMGISSDIALNGISDNDLKLAVRPVITSIKDMMETNEYWLNRVLSGSHRYPEQLDWSRTIIKDYASITKDEISLITKKYLKNNMKATITIKPKSRSNS